jgi:UDP-N-acetylmuramoyl-L-alanyl-D-glutamate--2,6-diaminopimelate ligase
VDYAHTPDALKNVLETIRDIRSGGGKIITVVGCGGNRDKDKRPVMAEIAAKLSDQVVITSDNPRDEEPGEIMAQMLAGVPVTAKRKVLAVENRKEAIAVACRLAQAEDIILVAGKGHETYQEVKGVKHPFDDREILAETFKTLES